MNNQVELYIDYHNDLMENYVINPIMMTHNICEFKDANPKKDFCLEIYRDKAYTKTLDHLLNDKRATAVFTKSFLMSMHEFYMIQMLQDQDFIELEGGKASLKYFHSFLCLDFKI